MLTTTEIHPEDAHALEPAMLATTAEHLVRSTMPFRETHHVAGAAVRLAEKENTSLAGLSKAQLATLHPARERFDADVAAPGTLTGRRSRGTRRAVHPSPEGAGRGAIGVAQRTRRRAFPRRGARDELRGLAFPAT